jgi:hypothetical protein
VLCFKASCLWFLILFLTTANGVFLLILVLTPVYGLCCVSKPLVCGFFNIFLNSCKWRFFFLLILVLTPAYGLCCVSRPLVCGFLILFLTPANDLCCVARSNMCVCVCVCVCFQYLSYLALMVYEYVVSKALLVVPWRLCESLISCLQS